MTERLMQNLKRFLREEEGQSTTEYILILAVVVMIAMKFRDKVGGFITGRVEKLGTDLQNFDNMN
jgi:Flp pilus assembly pilin Flp